MVLYALYHGGHLPIVLVHKMTVHPDEEAVLLVSNAKDAHVGKAMDMSGFEKLFSKVILYQGSFGLHIKDSPEVIRKAIIEHYQEMITQESLDLETFSYIYNFTDALDSLGVYFSEKKIPWIVYEDFIDKFEFHEKNPKALYNIHSPVYKNYCEVLVNEEVFQTYKNPLITGLKQSEFCFLDKIKNLSESQRDLILEMYGVTDQKSASDILMLPSSNAALVVPSYKKKKEVRDYYFSENNAYLFTCATILDFTASVGQNVDIKPHPSMSKTLSNEKDMQIYPRYFPAEFMPFLTSLKYTTVIGYESTSMKHLPEILDIPTVINYSTYFGTQSYIFYRAYISYVICQRIFSGDFAYFGFKKELFQDINSNVDVDYPKKTHCECISSLKSNHSFTIIDNCEYTKEDYCSLVTTYIRKMPVNDVIVVLNSKEDYPFIHEDVDFSDFMIPVVICKNVSSDHAVGNFQNETIYFFCKNKDIRNKVRNFQYSRHLYYTGIELSVMPLTEAEMIMYKQQMFFRREKRKEVALLKQLMNDSDK